MLRALHIIPLGVLPSPAVLQALHPEQIEAGRPGIHQGIEGPSHVTKARLVSVTPRHVRTICMYGRLGVSQ